MVARAHRSTTIARPPEEGFDDIADARLEAPAGARPTFGVR